MNSKWDFLLSKFRNLGGIAENICQKEGNNGRGIFPVDNKLKSKIFTPSSLIIKKRDIHLQDGKVRIKEKKIYSKDTRDFFNYYQDNFSWGGGGKESTESFENSLRLFPKDLKELLKDNRLIDIEERHQGIWKNVILSQFLYAREFNFKNQSQIVPMLELVNHNALSFQFYKSNSGISTPNYPPLHSELTYSYGNQGSLACLFKYGFFSKESIVFSFPFNFVIKDMGITLMCKGNSLRDDSMEIQKSEGNILIEGLPIADSNSPSLPECYFRELLDQIGGNDFPIAPLRQIINFNKLIRKNILFSMKTTNSDTSTMLEKAINYEIELLRN